MAVKSPELRAAFLVYPGVTQLDFTAPAQILASAGIAVECAGKTLDPIATSSGFSILPSTTLAGCGAVDILCVPGGGGCVAVMEDADVLDWLRATAAQARYVTSVCTGSLILAAAGLLDGYRATTHWAWLDYLPLFGATVVRDRVVVDRNRVTGGGVTAGLDLGLQLIAETLGEEKAKLTQLMLEYDPAPPFSAGSPVAAGAAVTQQALALNSTAARSARIAAIAGARGYAATLG